MSGGAASGSAGVKKLARLAPLLTPYAHPIVVHLLILTNNTHTHTTRERRSLPTGARVAF